jgi:hypothetical protein
MKRRILERDFWLRPNDDDADLIRHSPVWTKAGHPYAYDPFTIWGAPQPDARCNGSTYTDRMEQHDRKRYHALAERHYRGGDPVTYHRPFDSHRCRGDLIEQFLREWEGDPDLTLIRVIEYCDVSNGYPTWRLDYVTSKCGV